MKIVLPEEIAERGTRLRQKIVRPPVVEDRTRQRPAAPQTSDTVARPRQVGEPAPDAAVAEAAAPSAGTDARRATKKVLAGVLAAALVAVVAIALLSGDKARSPDDGNGLGADEDPPTVVPGEFVPTPTDFGARVAGSAVRFTWATDEPRSGDRFAFRYSVGDRERPIAALTKHEFHVNARRGAIVCGQVQLVRRDSTASQPTGQKCAVSR